MNYKESIEYLEGFLEANKEELSRELRMSIETAIFAMREQIKSSVEEKLDASDLSKYIGYTYDWDKTHEI